MDLHIAQECKEIGSKWYEWSVWLEGADADLDSVKAVRYKLHETFPDPVQLITDRGSKFRLRSSGWGEFMIHADVLLYDGDEIPLRHWLRFGESEATPARRPLKDGPLTAFLSASAADEALADALQASLEEKGVKVLRPSDDSMLPLNVALQRLIEQASVAVMIFSDRASPWLKAELKEVEHRKVPLFPVIVGGEDRLPQSLKGIEQVQRIQVKSGLPASTVAENVAQTILQRSREM